MTTPRSPEGEMVDIMELDREIEALRMGAGRSADDGLLLLLELRDDVDRRAATLPLQGDFASDTRPECSASVASRRRSHHRLAVIPVAGALVLASTGAAAALSGSPQAPLYPLHRLVFGAAASSDRQLGHDLAEAQMLLNRAAAEPYAARASVLSQARLILAQAQDLLPRATSRTQFSLQLSAALARLAALEMPPTTGGPLPLPAPSPNLPPKPNVDGEGSTRSDPANSEIEPSGVAPGGSESEAPESVPAAGNTAASVAPEGANSAATHPARGESDGPVGAESGSNGSESRDN